MRFTPLRILFAGQLAPHQSCPTPRTLKTPRGIGQATTAEQSMTIGTIVKPRIYATWASEAKVRDVVGGQ
jgi:hypothetical protein